MQIDVFQLKNVVFAKGTIDKINETRELSFGQFAIVTKNEKVKEKLASGTLVRIQKKVTGDLEDCDQIQAVGSTLVENGIVSTNNSDGMREDRHPRTCIGIQEMVIYSSVLLMDVKLQVACME